MSKIIRICVYIYNNYRQDYKISLLYTVTIYKHTQTTEILSFINISEKLSSTNSVIRWASSADTCILLSVQSTLTHSFYSSAEVKYQHGVPIYMHPGHSTFTGHLINLKLFLTMKLRSITAYQISPSMAHIKKILWGKTIVNVEDKPTRHGVHKSLAQL